MTTTAHDSTSLTAPMSREQMCELIERHLAAEAAGDVDAAIAVYTDDVEHDVVGWPGGPVRGGDSARAFYDVLTSNFATGDVDTNHEYFGENVCVVEHQWRGTIPGDFMGVPGGNKPVDFRMLHVFEFRDGLISRENVWLDGGTIMAQLTA